MTLQTSGAISLGDIQGEFGGVNPIGINEYYGKGGVPASGTLSVGDFYGKANTIWTSPLAWSTATPTYDGSRWQRRQDGTLASPALTTGTLNGQNWVQVAFYAYRNYTGALVAAMYYANMPAGNYILSGAMTSGSGLTGYYRVVVYGYTSGYLSGTQYILFDQLNVYGMGSWSGPSSFTVPSYARQVTVAIERQTSGAISGNVSMRVDGFAISPN